MGSFDLSYRAILEAVTQVSLTLVHNRVDVEFLKSLRDDEIFVEENLFESGEAGVKGRILGSYSTEIIPASDAFPDELRDPLTGNVGIVMDEITPGLPQTFPLPETEGQV